MNISNAAWLRRLPVLLAAIVLAGAMMGVLSCHLTVSGDTVATQGTPPGNQVMQTTPAPSEWPSREDGEPSDLSGDLYATAALTFTPVATVYLPLVSRAGGTDKWALWTGPTQLRGANVFQRRVYLELDGPDFFGPGPVGPPYTQADFDALAAMGANYVNISHPGLYTETAPYVLDPAIQANLDDLLTLIANADMFAVISFRTVSSCAREASRSTYTRPSRTDTLTPGHSPITALLTRAAMSRLSKVCCDSSVVSKQGVLAAWQIIITAQSTDMLPTLMTRS